MIYSEFSSFYSEYLASRDSTNASSSNSSHCGDSLCFTGEGEGLRWIEKKKKALFRVKMQDQNVQERLELGKWEYDTEYI